MKREGRAETGRDRKEKERKRWEKKENEVQREREREGEREKRGKEREREKPKERERGKILSTTRERPGLVIITVLFAGIGGSLAVPCVLLRLLSTYTVHHAESRK